MLFARDRISMPAFSRMTDLFFYLPTYLPTCFDRGLTCCYWASIASGRFLPRDGFRGRPGLEGGSSPQKAFGDGAAAHCHAHR